MVEGLQAEWRGEEFVCECAHEFGDVGVGCLFTREAGEVVAWEVLEMKAHPVGVGLLCELRECAGCAAFVGGLVDLAQAELHG